MKMEVYTKESLGLVKRKGKDNSLGNKELVMLESSKMVLCKVKESIICQMDKSIKANLKRTEDMVMEN